MRPFARRGLAAVAMCAVSGCGTLLSLGDDTGETPPAPRDAALEAAVEATPDGSTPESDAPSTDGSLGADVADAAVVDACVACDRVVFVTEQRFIATDVATADQRCTSAAESATAAARVKDRPFVAWTSTSTLAAGQKVVHGTGKYILADGNTIANDFTALLSTLVTPLATTINVNERGVPVVASGPEVYVWTGTAANANYAAPSCSNWTSVSAGASAAVGNLTSVDVGWSHYIDQSCASMAHLYCFER